MSLKDVIGLTEVPPANQENYPPEDMLPEDGLYHYLLKPGKEHNNQLKRAMDRIWSDEERSHRVLAIG